MKAYNKQVAETIRKPPLVKVQTALKNKKIMAKKNDFQYGGWNYYTLQCGMWLWNHDSEFTKWQHPAVCSVIRGSGMTCHGIRPNVRRIGILHLVSISTISTQSTCPFAPVCEILSKSDHTQQNRMTSCRFSRWRISAILDFLWVQ